MTPQDPRKIQSVQNIRTKIPQIVSLVIAGTILLLVGIMYLAEKKQQEGSQNQPIRLACPAGAYNSKYVEIPGENKLSARVSIPPGCDVRVLGDSRKKIHMVTFPDEKPHTPGIGVKKLHENNPYAIAFFSSEKTDVTVVFFPIGTLER